MRVQVFLAFLLAVALPGLAQTADNSAPGLPDDPGRVLARVVPSYDYSTLKPWHLKATYQLFDDAGKPTEQGNYELWWASNEVYRSSWTRGSATYTEWHTADGKVAYVGRSGEFNYFEHKLEPAYRSPLTSAGELDPARFRLNGDPLTAPKSIVSCYITVPVASKDDPASKPTLGLFPTYCINTKLEILLGIYSLGTHVVKFNDFTQIEGKYLGRGVYFREGVHDILTAQVNEISELSPSDPALKPPQEATAVRIDRVRIGADIAESLLIKKVAPVYPQEAKDAHIQGEVILQATIGIDGGVRDLQLLSAPTASGPPSASAALSQLVSSAFWCVSQWQYKPYLRNGEPVEVETTVAVPYSLGQ
jgi:hypothetical protein